MIPEFYTPRPQWSDQIELIGEKLGRISVLEGLTGNNLELRRSSRVNSVHSSTAIEGNELTLAQVAALAEGKPSFGEPRAITEVENALAAYEALDELDPWNVDDLLRAHRLLTAGLQPEAGQFRTVDVEIVNADGDVLHTGSRVEKVPQLISELFEWASASTDHPLVISSAVHYMIEHIHPFRDGNGRIGRLWQALILSQWRPVFAWMPTETLIRRYQQEYYSALQASREPEIDAAYFIDFMLGAIAAALDLYQTQAREQATDVGIKDGINVGIRDRLLGLLRVDPTLSAQELAAKLGRTSRTIERYLSALKSEGKIRRDGSRKAGEWIVLDEAE